jgi:uncharacterized protein (TIGR02145 family)
MLKQFLFLLLFPCIVFLISCSHTEYSANQEEENKGMEIVTDYDVNQYKTVKIGNQIWMAENLRSTRYSDGTIIQGISVYDNDEANAKKYGRLYHWKTISNLSGLCPPGWHVASDEDWRELEKTLGMNDAEVNDTGWRKTHNESRKLKKFDTAYSWNAKEKEEINKSGFSAVPSGARTRRDLILPFWGGGRYSDYWTSTASDASNAWNRSLVWSPWHPGSDEIFRNTLNKEFGFSIRCIKN